MVLLTLICALVKEGRAFSVDIDNNKSVGHLKDAIKEGTSVIIQITARKLQLFLAKRDEGRGAWLTETEVKQGAWSTSGLTLLEYAGAPLSVVGFTEEAVRTQVTKEDVAAGIVPVHVLVKLPEPIVYAASLTTNVQLPTTTALNEPEKYAEECISLNDWDVNAVQKIPSIWRFMSSLGGCTLKEEIYWRMENTLIVSLLMDGWFRESSSLANKKSIIIGSPGIGKSTLLCVMAFHLVFKHRKNVLVYRRLRKKNQADCLFYMGYEDGKVVQFAVKGCEDRTANDIYKELVRQQGISNVWLLLDKFRYKDIPVSLTTFTLLATSERVDLKSEDQLYALYCLMPCWSPTDLFSM
ncbi:unnamed protein product [Peronospora farinosa]|uniref:Crinkler effector protein N-terminal domain-containing protein n=1 Tax=Peronospora farinosa TaxID=134698 RepID=A0ABN8C981_9STRA|nr:unnamed protein product [Peronospora farinosa]